VDEIYKHTQSTKQGKIIITIIIIIIIVIIVIIIQFNSYLFMCKLNSTEAYYKVSTGTEEEKIHIQRKYKKQGN
jgi:flagellar basal body-associated protein FliL